MIGYWIVIAAQTPEERDLSIDRKAAVLANWETGRAAAPVCLPDARLALSASCSGEKPGSARRAQQRSVLRPVENPAGYAACAANPPYEIWPACIGAHFWALRVHTCVTRLQRSGIRDGPRPLFVMQVG